MPFGTIASVIAWHRVGGAIRDITEALFKVAVLRYVDDKFGAAKIGFWWHGGRCVSFISMLIGFPCNEEKSESNAETMVVLGAECTKLRTGMDKDKQWHYACQRKAHEVPGRGGTSRAGRVHGRWPGKQNGGSKLLRSVSSRRQGWQGTVKPFYAQQHQPRPYLTFRMRLALTFWKHYYKMDHKAVRWAFGINRRQVQMWTDASGEGEIMAAVLKLPGETQQEDVWLVTSIKMPEFVKNQLHYREDHQIGIQEALGIVLGLTTFQRELNDTLLLDFQDNVGVLGAVLKGSSGCLELNIIVNHIWVQVAQNKIGLHLARVESKANIADGPTRGRWDLLQKLGAERRQPQWPNWLKALWNC